MQSLQAGRGEELSVARMSQERIATLEGLMERAVSPWNWEVALCAVERNDGAAGPDGMTAKELRRHLAEHGETIRRRLLEGRYVPSAARRKDLPKPDGGTRPLSIPNVQDRFVQHLLLSVLEPLFEPEFSDSSYGFRPGRSAHQAVQAAQRYAREGLTWVVDMDITKFFDRVNHDLLMHRIGEVVKDKRVLKLIGANLRAGVILPDGLLVRSEEGTPQGGPLSPLLANIYLDALDKELEKRGLRFARYADDCNIYVQSKAAAERVMTSITSWLTRKLRLEVNASKSGVGRPWERKFLGFTLTVVLLITLASTSLARFENKVRELWDGRQAQTSKQLRDQWRSYVRGWWGYFSLAEDRRSILGKEGWLRRHIRKCFWQRWHSAEGRVYALRKLGIPPQLENLGRSSCGAWHMAAHKVMQRALPNRRLRYYGFLTPSDLDAIKRDGSNRRMRKTARPVV
jgi:group II intron reverse transcriptase/maturase